MDIKKQLKDLDVSRLKLKSGNTIERELKRHAAILANCIMLELDKVYDSYDPKKYERTFDLYNSLIKIDKIRIHISTAGTNLSLKLFFDEGAMHPSFDGDLVPVAWLINDGWQTHGWFADVPYLGFREASNYIEHGIEKYKKSVNNPFQIKLTKGDETQYF